MNWEWGDSENLMAQLSGAQILRGSIEPDGLHIQFSDSRVLVIVCLPSECLGLALLRPQEVLH